jgi:hypothetical protein
MTLSFRVFGDFFQITRWDRTFHRELTHFNVGLDSNRTAKKDNLP